VSIYIQNETVAMQLCANKSKGSQYISMREPLVELECRYVNMSPESLYVQREIYAMQLWVTVSDSQYIHVLELLV